MNKNLTQNLTGPLIIKIVGAFGFLILLILSLTILSVGSINQVKTDSQTEAEVNSQAQSLFNLSGDVQRETQAYYSALQSGIDDGSFSRANTTFLDEVGPFVNPSGEAGQVLEEHDRLTGLISNALAILHRGDIGAARTAQDAIGQASNKLTNLLNQMLQQKFGQANQVRRQTIDSSNNSDGFMTLWALIIIILTCAIIWFVFAKVLTPLRLLNENLAQLLWGQTEHLTDRLNLLQYEIVNYNDMLTAVRHDLKSPLSSIKGLAELSLILHPDLNDDLHDNLDQIMHVSDSSVSLISNLLTRRETRLDLQETDLGQLVDKVLQLVDLRLYNVQRKVEADRAVLDAGLMEHALLNLIGNARKFSDGGLAIGVQKTRKAGTVATEEIEFWVWNDGTVINAEQRGEIFKPGVQTEEGKKAGGHGLGLAIVKNIAELHHGRVNVDSHIKVGTTFRITLPTLIATPTSNPNHIPLPVLLTTDDQHLAEILTPSN